MADQTSKTSRYFDYDGPVHYIDYGGAPDGPLVVCVHGLGGSAISFDLIGPLLAAQWGMDAPRCWAAPRRSGPTVGC